MLLGHVRPGFKAQRGIVELVVPDFAHSANLCILHAGFGSDSDAFSNLTGLVLCKTLDLF